jgi:DNA adenine methylase
MRPFLKWLGGKKRHLQHLLPHVPPQYNTYWEPFLGSGALFLALQPKKWVINDLNSDLVSVWKWVQEKDPRLLEEYFSSFGKIFISKSNQDKLLFCREMTDSLNGKKQVTFPMDMLLMLHCCYMALLWKHGRYYFYGLDPHIYSENKYFFLTPRFFENLTRVHHFLKTFKGKIENQDYRKILRKTKKNDFVFLDPPYWEPDQEYNFEYNAEQKTDVAFYLELYRQVVLLDQKGVFWMMTQADTPFMRKLFNEYTIYEFPVFRPRSRTHKNELLIKNYP